MKFLHAFHRPGKGYCDMTAGDIANRAGMSLDEARLWLLRASRHDPQLAYQLGNPPGGFPSTWRITPEGVVLADELPANGGRRFTGAPPEGRKGASQGTQPQSTGCAL